MMIRVASFETVCAARKMLKLKCWVRKWKIVQIVCESSTKKSISICGNSTRVLGCEFYANQKQTKHKKLDVSLCCCCTDGKSGNSWVNSEASRTEMRANMNNGRVWRQEGIIIRMCIYPLIFSLLLFEHNWIKFEWWIITTSSSTHR